MLRPREHVSRRCGGVLAENVVMTPIQPPDPTATVTTFFDTLAQQFADAERYPIEARDYSATRGQGFAIKLETGEQFYERVLADGLKFRRAGGPPAVDKAAFLKGLTNPDNTTEEISASESKSSRTLRAW